MSVPPAPSHGEHGTDDTAPRRARQSRRARRAHCRRLPLPTRPATCRACARGRAANPLRPARGPPSHHGAWKVGANIEQGAWGSSRLQSAKTAPHSPTAGSPKPCRPGTSLHPPCSPVSGRPALVSRGRPVWTTAPPAGSVPSRPCPMAHARAVIGDKPVRLGRRVSAVNRPVTRWAGPRRRRHRTARSTVLAIRVRHTGSTGRAAAATLQVRSFGCAIQTCLALSRARLTAGHDRDRT